MFWIIKLMYNGNETNNLSFTYNNDFSIRHNGIRSSVIYKIFVFDDTDNITECINEKELGYYLSLGVKIKGVSKIRLNRGYSYGSFISVSVNKFLPSYNDGIILEKVDRLFDKNKKFNPYLLDRYGYDCGITNVIHDSNLYYIRDDMLYKTYFKNLNRQRQLFKSNLAILGGDLLIDNISWDGSVEHNVICDINSPLYRKQFKTLTDILRNYVSYESLFTGVSFDSNSGKLIIDTLTKRFIYKVESSVMKKIVMQKISGVFSDLV